MSKKKKKKVSARNRKGENSKCIRRDHTECIVTVKELRLHDEIGYVCQGRRENQA